MKRYIRFNQTSNDKYSDALNLLNIYYKALTGESNRAKDIRTMYVISNKKVEYSDSTKIDCMVTLDISALTVTFWVNNKQLGSKKYNNIDDLIDILVSPMSKNPDYYFQWGVEQCEKLYEKQN